MVKSEITFTCHDGYTWRQLDRDTIISDADQETLGVKYTRLGLASTQRDDGSWSPFEDPDELDLKSDADEAVGWPAPAFAFFDALEANMVDPDGDTWVWDPDEKAIRWGREMVRLTRDGVLECRITDCPWQLCSSQSAYKQFFRRALEPFITREVVHPSSGRKDDQEKNRLDLLPFEALEEVAKVLTYAAVKYAVHNWRKGMAWHRLFGAALRHLWAWYRGEKMDPESGCSHLAHAGCCVLFLLTYELKGLGNDDRPESTTPNSRSPS